MTVAELIAKLQEFPPDARVFSFTSPDAEPCDPEPKIEDWGPGHSMNGVYL